MCYMTEHACEPQIEARGTSPGAPYRNFFSAVVYFFVIAFVCLDSMSKKWEDLLRTGKIEKCKIAELKEYLKTHKMTQGGEKGTLINRIRMHIEGQKHQIDGSNPAELPIAALRKTVAGFGLSCIGTQDEMLELLITHLKENPGVGGPTAANESNASSNSSVPAATGTPDEDVEAKSIRLAKTALRLSEEGDDEGILRLLGDDITKASSVGALRKAYLKLSLLLHPDKLQDKFDGATRAFQALVSAFEHVSRPELAPAKKGEKPKGPMISRSNQGCFVTAMACPRCKVEWGKKVEGNPEYYYNFMMMGVKSFTCSTCLLQFGCMTALHKCPHCRQRFEYHPEDYHRKIKCCNKDKCGKEFGFWLFDVSERVLQELHKEVKDAQERRMQREEAKRRRTAAALRRQGSMDARASAVHEEKLFLLGLRDACPRCGESLEGLPDEEAQRKHLMECADVVKIAQHKAKQERLHQKAAERERREGLQEEVAATAAWALMGGQSQHLWFLSEAQLQKQCADVGLDTSGTKEELIARLAEHRKDQRFIGGPDGEDVPEVSGATLPSNLHGMSEGQLRAVCASHNIDPKPLKSKKALIKALEGAQYASFMDGPKVQLLAQPKTQGRLTDKKEKKRPREPEVGDCDSDDEPLVLRRKKRKGSRSVVSSDDEDFCVEAAKDVEDID